MFPHDKIYASARWTRLLTVNSEVASTVITIVMNRLVIPTSDLTSNLRRALSLLINRLTESQLKKSKEVIRADPDQSPLTTFKRFFNLFRRSFLHDDLC